MKIAGVLFPNLTQLDLTGPFEVFHRIPHARVQLAAKTMEPVQSEGGLSILPTITFAELHDTDLLFVPGGPGVNEAMLDEELLAFLRRPRVRWYGSACTGALILGAAGLLKGHKAATHWASMQFLETFGAIPTYERVVVDGNRFTGGGVTAGIDIALGFVREIFGERTANEIALSIEYGPMREDIRSAVLERLGPMLERRQNAVQLAAAKLKG